MTELRFDGTFEGWKRAARRALTREVSPENARWIDTRCAQPELTLAAREEPGSAAETPSTFRVSREFVSLAADVACHRDAERWPLLYRALWRITHGEPHLLDIAVDADIAGLNAMAKAVRREIHKPHAFVRFREITTDTGPWFVAWFEPQHHVLEAAAQFFVDRFSSMRWSILTPERCAHWDGQALSFTEGVTRDAAPADDAAENLWRTYYGSIFNPARVKIGAMVNEMPRRYWKNLPETAVIPSLVAQAAPRVSTMIATSDGHRIGADEYTAAPVPTTNELNVLRDAAATCRACPLWRKATCTVFGQGSSQARVVVVGEQPGDQEDRTGKPFVGPAGQLFDRALRAAEINRETLYVTNAVKHFKWEPRGKRRLHQKPSSREIAACRPWLEAELRAIEPRLIVCLGGTAAQSVLGTPVRVLSERGQLLATPFNAPALITVHPSSLLRLPPGSDPAAAFDAFVADLRKIAPPERPSNR